METVTNVTKLLLSVALTNDVSSHLGFYLDNHMEHFDWIEFVPVLYYFIQVT